jgi:virginiamycin B lyase
VTFACGEGIDLNLALQGMSSVKEICMDRKNQIILCCAVLAMGLGVAFSSQAAAPGQEVSELKVEIHEWQGPTKGAHPHDPAVGPDGALWFTEQMANKLGRLDPATGAFKEYPLVEGKNSGPHGLVADKEGNIWFTANFGGYIGKLDPRTGKVTQYKMPDESVDDPHTAAFDAHGILWFTAQGGNAVGRLDPRTGKIELNKVPTESALPYGDSD